MSESVLLVDDDPVFLRSMRRTLSQRYDVDVAGSGAEGVHMLGDRPYDALVVDLGMPDIDGFDVLRYARRTGRTDHILVVSGRESLSDAVAAMREGATDYISKPIAADGIHDVLARVFGTDCREDNLEAWRRAHAPGIIGESSAIKEALSLAKRVSEADCDVLLVGESGTGKELFAQCIHEASNRVAKPFLPINCAAIPKDLVESELFGHARGAFTGAQSARRGYFRDADGGSIMLDELGELPIDTQAKLLRVLQEREVMPVGQGQREHVDVRVISATNRDLSELSEQGKFRADLYYRVNVLCIEIPALRERREDVPLLAQHFATLAARKHGKPCETITAQGLERLTECEWPGNIRQLRNAIERAVVLKPSGSSLDTDDFATKSKVPTDAALQFEEGVTLNDALTRLELKLTMKAMRRSKGNKAKAAEFLGLKRTTLVERLKKLGLTEHSFSEH